MLLDLLTFQYDSYDQFLYYLKLDLYTLGSHVLFLYRVIQHQLHFASYIYSLIHLSKCFIVQSYNKALKGLEGSPHHTNNKPNAKPMTNNPHKVIKLTL